MSRGTLCSFVNVLTNYYQVFVDKAAIVPRRARMASTGVMVFRRLLEPALSLLRDSGVMVTIVRAGHGQHHSQASRTAPGGQLITQSSHFNAASH